jgi:hypothetical protein
MMKAAYKMTQLVGNSLELLSDCTIDEVISTDEQLKNITDPTGLFLNSLLVPLQNTSLHSRLRIRFAHRAYQEFFLSLFIRDNSSDFHGAELPEAIKRLLIDLETEGICDA